MKTKTKKKELKKLEGKHLISNSAAAAAAVKNVDGGATFKEIMSLSLYLSC